MLETLPVYLDYNATTPVDPRVLEAMLPYLGERFGNPSSGHFFGRQAREAVDHARGQVAGFLGCSPAEILFTSGGSEANNLALRGLAEGRKPGRMVISAVEHPAITEVCRHLESLGHATDILPVDGDGRVDPADLDELLSPDTCLVSVMHANNEVGTVQPVAELARRARERGIPFHSDAAQSAGKIPVKANELGVDLLSLAGHKLYAPKGVGALFVREGVELRRLIHGAGHEGGLRAGTENVAGIVGLGMACEIAEAAIEEETLRLRGLRDRLEELLTTGWPGARLNGHRDERLPNTLSISLPGLPASVLLREAQGLAASAGSACHADGSVASPVLAAMKLDPARAAGTLRLSLGRFSSAEDVERAASEILAVARRLRRGA